MKDASYILFILILRREIERELGVSMRMRARAFEARQSEVRDTHKIS